MRGTAVRHRSTPTSLCKCSARYARPSRTRNALHVCSLLLLVLLDGAECARLQVDMERIIADSARIAGIAAPLELSWGDMYDEDWEAQVKDSYKPLQLLDDLWIVPEWCAIPAHALLCRPARVRVRAAHQGLRRLGVFGCRCEPPELKATNLFLKPGIAFGTGEHATTRLCLRWLRAAQVSGATVVDYGCGSGILSVAACLYGARHVVRSRPATFS